MLNIHNIIENNLKKCYYHDIKRGENVMLVEYRVENFKSFKDEIVLSMVASSDNQYEETNVVKKGKFRLLNTVGMFGSNASGKSNVFASINYLRDIFTGDNKGEKDYLELPVFKLNRECEDKPIKYEVTFLIGEIRHRYVLHISKKGIVHEALYFCPSTKEAKYFSIIDGLISTGTNFGEKSALNYITASKYRPFLNTLAQDDIKGFDWAKEVEKYIISLFPMHNSIDLKYLLDDVLYEKNDHIATKEQIVKILKGADKGIDDIHIKINTLQENKSNNKKNSNSLKDKYITYMLHKSYYGENYEPSDSVEFSFDIESEGTKKIYKILMPIILTLLMGDVLFIDEISSSLHTLLCIEIIKMFNDRKINKNGAQLIFSSHNVMLMNSDLLRRDQIYFLEKNKFGESELFSLSDFGVRKDCNYISNYLAGQFGAIPYFEDFFSLNAEGEGR